VAEPVSALRDLDELSGYTEQNPLSVGEEQQKAIQELERRGINPPEKPEFGYDYGGDRGLTDMFMPFRREVISPEQTIPTGNISFGPRGNMQQEVKTIPAQYGESEFGMEYMPLVRGTKSALNAVGDFFFGDAGEQAAVAKSALNMAEGLGQYATEQVKAAASGGQYYDSEQQRIVSFDPTTVMFGGNPATGQAVLGSGVRLSSGGSTGNRIAGASALRDITGETPEVTRDTTLLERVLDVDSVNNMNPVWGDPELRSVPIARASDLEDRAYMTGITDTTDSSLRNLISLDGVPIDEKMRGGTFFGFQPEQMERGHAFASAEKAIQGQINRANVAQQLSGREGVVFVPHGMTGDSPDFATMPTNIAVKYSKAMMEPSDKKLLDERIRNGVLTKNGDKYAAGKEPVADWMGIDNVTDEYLASIGGKRKNVTRALDEFREAGALNLSQSRALVTDPSQFNKDWGMVNSMYLLDDLKEKPRSPHPSYPFALTGRPIGATTEGFSILDWNPSYLPDERNFIEDMVRKGQIQGQAYIDMKKLDDGTVGFQKKKIQPIITKIKGYDVPNRERPVIGGRARNAGSSLAGALRSGGQGIITREMIDDLIARGLILSD